MSKFRSSRHVLLGIFTFVLVIESVHAEVAAPNSSGSSAPSAPRTALAPVSEDPLVKSLDGMSLRPGRGNDKSQCPGGKFLLTANSGLMIYTKRNDEGIFFGAGEMFILEPTTEDQVMNSVKKDMETNQAVSCRSVTRRTVVQEQGELSVTETRSETCGGKSYHSKVRLDIKEVNGKKTVKYKVDSDDPKAQNYACSYFESVERPRPERPFKERKLKN